MAICNNSTFGISTGYSKHVTTRADLSMSDVLAFLRKRMENPQNRCDLFIGEPSRMPNNNGAWTVGIEKLYTLVKHVCDTDTKSLRFVDMHGYCSVLIPTSSLKEEYQTLLKIYFEDYDALFNHIEQETKNVRCNFYSSY